MAKPTIAVIGAGWGGFNFSHNISLAKHNVVVISPIRTIQYTPLLASSAAGMFNFRLAEEPVRRRSKPGLQFHLASATDVDFDKQIVSCTPAVENFETENYTLPYDKIIIAPGCDTHRAFDDRIIGLGGLNHPNLIILIIELSKIAKNY